MRTDPSNTTREAPTPAAHEEERNGARLMAWFKSLLNKLRFGSVVRLS